MHFNMYNQSGPHIVKDENSLNQRVKETNNHV